tara:strand:+ start:496 stop:789 length:294 start_codon:yes stop_codon:yes gene_type:complete
MPYELPIERTLKNERRLRKQYAKWLKTVLNDNDKLLEALTKARKIIQSMNETKDNQFMKEKNPPVILIGNGDYAKAYYAKDLLDCPTENKKGLDNAN